MLHVRKVQSSSPKQSPSSLEKNMQKDNKDYSETSMSPKTRLPKNKFVCTGIQAEIFESNLEKQNHQLKMLLQKKAKLIENLRQKIKSLMEQSFRFDKEMKQMEFMLSIYRKGVKEARKHYSSKTEVILREDQQESSMIKEERSEEPVNERPNEFDESYENDGRSFERDEVLRRIMKCQQVPGDIQDESYQNLDDSQIYNRSAIEIVRKKPDYQQHSMSDISNNYEPVSHQIVRSKEIYDDENSNYSFSNINMMKKKNDNQKNQLGYEKIKVEDNDLDSLYRLKDLISSDEEGCQQKNQFRNINTSKIQFQKNEVLAKWTPQNSELQNLTTNIINNHKKLQKPLSISNKKKSNRSFVSKVSSLDKSKKSKSPRKPIPKQKIDSLQSTASKTHSFKAPPIQKSKEYEVRKNKYTYRANMPYEFLELCLNGKSVQFSTIIHIGLFDVSRIQMISLGNNNLGNNQLKMLVNFKWLSLKSLNIWENQITDIEPLVKLDLDKLFELCVSWNPLNKSSAQFLAKQEFDVLFHLEISFEPTKNDEFLNIMMASEMKNFPNLGTIKVYDREQISVSTKRKLRSIIDKESKQRSKNKKVGKIIRINLLWELTQKQYHRRIQKYYESEESNEYTADQFIRTQKVTDLRTLHEKKVRRGNNTSKSLEKEKKQHKLRDKTKQIQKLKRK